MDINLKNAILAIIMILPHLPITGMEIKHHTPESISLQHCTINGIPDDVKNLIVKEIGSFPDIFERIDTLENLRLTNKKYARLVKQLTHENKDLGLSLFSLSSHTKAITSLKEEKPQLLNKYICSFPRFYLKTLEELIKKNAEKQMLSRFLERTTLKLNALIEQGARIDKAETSEISKIAFKLDTHINRKLGPKTSKLWQLLTKAGAEFCIDFKGVNC